MMGPTLIAQDKGEAVGTVKKRIEFIKAEVAKADKIAAEAKKKVDAGKAKMAEIKAKAEALQKA
jgi:prefoldin beta subunit